MVDGLSAHLSGETAQKTQYLGSNCTGSSGALNRRLVHTKQFSASHLIIVGRAVLIQDTDYTINSTTATFLIPIDDGDTIVVST